MKAVRSSLRTLHRRPLEAVVIVAVLALGLSAGIAAFAYLKAFDRPFPGARSDGLVRLFGVVEEDPNQDLSYLDFLDYAEAGPPVVQLAAAQPYYAASVRLEASTEVAHLEAVSGDLFAVLGARAVLGRLLAAADDVAGAAPAAVISSAWWRRSFGADSTVIGRTIHLNFQPFTVVGVASPEFVGVAADFRPDVWIPITPFRDRYTNWSMRAENRDLPLVRVYGRLAPDVPAERVRAALGTVAARLDAVHPRPEGAARRLRLGAATWIDPAVREAERPTLRLMGVAAAVFLMLACANVANLLLSVALRRQHEVSLRAALGASPGRLVGRALADHLLLSLIAGGVALACAGPLSARFGSYFARPSFWNMDVARESPLDWRVVAFAVALTVATGLVAGLLPATRALRRNLVDMLKPEERSSGGVPRRWRGHRLPGSQELLVATQVGLAVVLLVVAGLVLRTLEASERLDPGFDPRQMVTTHISTSSTTIEVAGRDRFFRELVRRLAEEPWVRSATMADYPPLGFHREVDLLFDGREESVPLVYSNVVPGFFAALGIDVLRGRPFTDADDGEAAPVAVVNQALARRHFASLDAVGRRIRLPGDDGQPDRSFEIVGVVADSKTRDLFAETEPTVYFSYPQRGYPSGSALLVTVHGEPAAAVPLLHRWLREHEPFLAIVHVVPFADVVRGLLFTQRMNAEMFSGLALMGLALAAAGIFSVVALAVRRRTREIGIRMSIGARRTDIGRWIVGRALAPVGVGLLVGLTIALALARLARSLLFGVEPTDPVALAGGLGVLIVAAVVAAWLPARRAVRVDPSRALRHD